MRFFRSFLIATTAIGALLAVPVAASMASETPPAPPALGDYLRSGDLNGAFNNTMELAEANERDAQFNLALFYWHGVGAPQNYDEAIRWCTMAAIRGHKKAVAARKAMLEVIDAQVVKKAMETVRSRLIKEAELGDDTGLTPLSTSFLPSFGFPNEADAYVWASIAVSTGKIDARRQRDAIMSNMKQADIIKAQQRANDWFKRWRKAQS